MRRPPVFIAPALFHGAFPLRPGAISSFPAPLPCFPSAPAAAALGPAMSADSPPGVRRAAAAAAASSPPSGPGKGARRGLPAAMVALVRKHGLAALLSYGVCELITYSLSFLVALALWRRGAGAGVGLAALTRQAWAVIIAGTWGLNNLTRPLRLAGALFLTPHVERAVVVPGRRIWARWRGKSEQKDEEGEAKEGGG